MRYKSTNMTTKSTAKRRVRVRTNLYFDEKVKAIASKIAFDRDLSISQLVSQLIQKEAGVLK